MTHPLILLLVRLGSPDRLMDPARLDAARAITVWDAVVALETYCESAE